MILLNYRPTLMILITSLKVLSTNIIACGDGASTWILFTTPSRLSPTPPGTPRSFDAQRIQPLSLDDLPQWHLSVTASPSHTVLVTPDQASGDSPSLTPESSLAPTIPQAVTLADSSEWKTQQQSSHLYNQVDPLMFPPHWSQFEDPSWFHTAHSGGPQPGICPKVHFLFFSIR